jgi:hypothetical protein
MAGRFRIVKRGSRTTSEVNDTAEIARDAGDAFCSCNPRPEPIGAASGMTAAQPDFLEPAREERSGNM